MTLLNVVVAVLLDEFVQAVSNEKDQVRARVRGSVLPLVPFAAARRHSNLTWPLMRRKKSGAGKPARRSCTKASSTLSRAAWWSTR